MTQLALALLASLAERRLLTTNGAGGGILVGVALVAHPTSTKATMAAFAPALPGWIADLNVGIVALLLKAAVAVLVNLVERLATRAGALAI